MGPQLAVIDIGIDPMIQLGPVTIAWHGLTIALGILIGGLLAGAEARRRGLDPAPLQTMGIILIVGALVGSRVYYLAEHGGLTDPEAWLGTRGFTFYGGFIVVALGLGIYVRKQRLDIQYLDAIALGLTLGYGIGRIGDIINGEHFAKTTDLPWAVVYTHDNSPSVLRFGANYAQHPAVAYELLGDLLIFAILIFMYTRISRSGVTFFAWVFLYGLLRFWVSFLRLDDEVLGTGLRTAQLIGLGGIVAGLLGVAYMLRFPPREERTSRAERRRALRDEQPPGAEEHPAS